MLLRKFRQTSPDVIILISIILIMTWIGALIDPHDPSQLRLDDRSMPLFSIMLSIFRNIPFIGTLTGFLIVALISFLLVNLNTKVFFISERTFLPAVIYILLVSVFPLQQILNPVLPASVFLILSIQRIMDSYRVQGISFSFYDAGMLIGIGTLFYAPLIWFGLLLIIGIAILRTWNLKEILISLTGIATPIFIIYGFLYVTGKDMHTLFSDIKYNLFIKESDFSISVLIIVLLIITGIIELISVMHLLSAINSKKIKSRKTFVLFFWTLIIAIILFLIFKPVSSEIYWLAAIPPTYFLTHYFVFSRRKILPEIMFVGLLLITAVIQVITYLL